MGQACYRSFRRPHSPTKKESFCGASWRRLRQDRSQRSPQGRPPEVVAFAVLALRGHRGARCRCGACRGIGLLRFDEFSEHTSEVRERRIREDRKRLEAWILLKSLLLPLDDRLVFHEPLDEAVKQ